MKKLTLVFLTDPGHGWLKVPRKILQDAALLDKISPYSYQRNKHVYLEEDCDAPILTKHLESAGVKLTIKQKNSRKYSKIRSYDRFRSHLNFFQEQTL